MAKHGQIERERQSRFRTTSNTISEAGKSPTDEQGQRNGYLLARGSELENLFPAIREAAPAFFKERGIGWWRSAVSGDRPARETGGLTPTRNMASSQVACVNLLLPLRDSPQALTALLRTVDPTVEEVVPIRHQGRPPTFVEFEWVGCSSTLEEGPWTRGANATSIDAMVLGKGPGGTRAFLLEWKYVETGGCQDMSGGERGRTRLANYSERYERCRLFKPTLKQVLVAPIYQLVRSVLLGHRMVELGELGVTGARTVVVCPPANHDFLKLEPPHAKRLGEDVTLEVAMKEHVLCEPDLFSVASQAGFVAAARRDGGQLPEGWSDYMKERYGW